jgi:hypothetical protein
VSCSLWVSTCKSNSILIILQLMCTLYCVATKFIMKYFLHISCKELFIYFSNIPNSSVHIHTISCSRYCYMSFMYYNQATSSNFTYFSRNKYDSFYNLLINY